MRGFLFSMWLGVLGLGAYEIPVGVVSVGQLEEAQEKAKVANKPVVLVVASKKQPET
ncbi:MAG: hypothetical protein AAGC74_14745 [Verrucomicrobiota bacterium]